MAGRVEKVRKRAERGKWVNQRAGSPMGRKGIKGKTEGRNERGPEGRKENNREDRGQEWESPRGQERE